MMMMTKKDAVLKKLYWKRWKNLISVAIDAEDVALSDLVILGAARKLYYWYNSYSKFYFCN